MDFRHHGPRTVSAKVIGAFFAPTLLNEGAVLKLKEMLAQLQREYGFVVDYSTALAGRNFAISMIYGDNDKTFKLLPSYLHMVQQANPGTIIDLQTDSSHRFQYAFIALSASIRGFKSSGRPVIVVDGTHLKGKYKGIMFVAATKDGNENIFPLAVGIGDKENDSSWTWFFRQLRRTFDCPDQLLFVSDQHLSIKNAIDAVYPGIPHGICTFHLQQNLAKMCRKGGASIIQMFQKASIAYRSREFDINMSNLSKAKERVFRKLMEIDPCRWARSKCLVRRYEFLTSNCAESLNGRWRWARRLPVCTLLESVRTLIGTWFVKHREQALARSHELTAYAAKKLTKSVEDGRTLFVEAINSTKFKVISGTINYIVDLNGKSCSCKEFDLNLIPCAHAAAAISKSKQYPTAFVSSYYTTQTWREMYAADMIPIPHPDEWCVPTEVKSRIVEVPINPRQAGRPRTSRISSSMSSSRSRSRCSRCNQTGHYRISCTESLPNVAEEEVEVPQSGRLIRCGTCREVGHNRRTCPLLNGE